MSRDTVHRCSATSSWLEPVPPRRGRVRSSARTRTAHHLRTDACIGVGFRSSTPTPTRNVTSAGRRVPRSTLTTTAARFGPASRKCVGGVALTAAAHRPRIPSGLPRKSAVVPRPSARAPTPTAGGCRAARVASSRSAAGARRGWWSRPSPPGAGELAQLDDPHGTEGEHDDATQEGSGNQCKTQRRAAGEAQEADRRPASHDAIAARFCSATRDGAIVRGCVCQS